MSCNNCNQQSPCTQSVPCECAVKDLSSSCILYTGNTLPNSGIPTNTNLTDVLVGLDSYIEDAISEINDSINLVNVGEEEGTEIYAGINGIGQRKIKKLNPFDGSVELTQDDDNIFIRAISAGTNWGTISGTLSDQTDLQSALNLKANLSGATFTGDITAPSFIKTGGTSSQFLKADGSVDSSVYLTNYAETDTLQDVTTRGATTTDPITANSFIKTGGLSTEYLMADGSVTTTTLPYKSYVATLSRDIGSATAPTATVIYNDLGVTVSYVYSVLGLINVVTSSSILNAGKVAVYITLGIDADNITVKAWNSSTNSCQISTRNSTTGNAFDAGLNLTTFEIRLYD